MVLLMLAGLLLALRPQTGTPAGTAGVGTPLPHSTRSDALAPSPAALPPATAYAAQPAALCVTRQVLAVVGQAATTLHMSGTHELHSIQSKRVGLKLQLAVRVAVLPTAGLAGSMAIVQAGVLPIADGGTGTAVPEACQETVAVAGSPTPAALVATT
jgi:hypothetical protein